MKTKAKCILVAVMVAICVLIMPAFSQGPQGNGGARQNENPGNNLGPAQDNEIGPGQNVPPGDQDFKPKFNGCNTWPQEMKDNRPLSNPPGGLENGNGAQYGYDTQGGYGAQSGQDLRSMPWQYVGQNDEQHGYANYGYSGEGKHAPPKSIMPDHFPKWHPKKSMMEMRHRMAPRPLMGNNFPEMPPMKSMMNYGR